MTPACQAVAKFGSLEVYVPPLPTVLPAVRIGITPDETNQLTSLLVCEKNHSAVVGSAVGLRPMPNAGKVLEKSKVPLAMSMSPNVTRAARLLEAAIRTPSRMATVVSPPAPRRCSTAGMPQGAGDLLERFAVLSTGKLPAAQRATSKFWPAHESEVVGPDPYALVLNRAVLGDLCITYVRCSARIRVRLLEPCRHPCLIVSLAGSIEITGDSGTYRAIPGQPLLRAAGWLRRFEAAPCRCLLLDITTAALERSSQAAGQDNLASLGHVSFSGEAADLLHGRALSLARAVNTSTRAVALQRLSEADRRRLLSAGIRGREASLLRALATAAATGPRSEQLAEPADVEAWLRQHAMSRVPLAELARRAGRSMRSIQRACRKLGYTPQALLRAVRLDRSRELLLDPAGGLTIADVAETVGYPHEGRFAGYYLERFGELPSATLARSRRPPAADSPRGIADWPFLRIEGPVGRLKDRLGSEREGLS